MHRRRKCKKCGFRWSTIEINTGDWKLNDLNQKKMAHVKELLKDLLTEVKD